MIQFLFILFFTLGHSPIFVHIAKVRFLTTQVILDLFVTLAQLYRRMLHFIQREWYGTVPCWICAWKSHTRTHTYAQTHSHTLTRECVYECHTHAKLDVCMKVKRAYTQIHMLDVCMKVTDIHIHVECAYESLIYISMLSVRIKVTYTHPCWLLSVRIKVTHILDVCMKVTFTHRHTDVRMKVARTEAHTHTRTHTQPRQTENAFICLFVR